MRILFISHFVPYPPHGGALQRNYHLIRKLSEDNEVYLLAFNQKKLIEEELELQTAKDVLARFCKLVEVYPIPSDHRPICWLLLLALNTFSLTPYSAWRFSSRRFKARLKRLVKEHKFDVVHLDTIALAPYRKVLVDQTVVLNHHNVESALLIRRASSESSIFKRIYIMLQGLKLHRYERIVLSRMQANIAVSELDIEQFKQILPTSKLELVPNGTDPQYFSAQHTDIQRELVFVGGLNWYPNVDGLIYFIDDILPLILRRVPDCRLRIIGRDAPVILEDKVEANPCVELMGYVEDIRPLVAQAAVYVVPLRVGGGTRLKILDAMAMGKAVVSTSIGAEGLAVTDRLDIRLADEPQEFADAVVELIDDSANRQVIQKNARELVEKTYSWDVIAPRLTAAYQKVAHTDCSLVV